MAKGKKTGGRAPGTPNKKPTRATEEREVAKNALVNTARGLLDHPQIITVLRRLGKERMTEVEEMALEEALCYREAARAGDVAARDQFYRYLSLALDAAARLDFHAVAASVAASIISLVIGMPFRWSVRAAGADCSARQIKPRASRDAGGLGQR
jgi:hypothetical protein